MWVFILLFIGFGIYYVYTYFITRSNNYFMQSQDHLDSDTSDQSILEQLMQFRLWQDQERQSQILQDQMYQDQMLQDQNMFDPYQNPGLDIVVDESYHGIDHGLGIANPDQFDSFNNNYDSFSENNNSFGDFGSNDFGNNDFGNDFGSNDW